tara:strand:- start:183 stop:1364 length:1182 start_codon:yes stop_codon:yes gene_type:complete
MNFFKKDNVLSVYFLYLILGIFIYSILQIGEFPQKYVFTEWLINYEGGYVRRGILGQLIFEISNIFNIDIKILILFFQISIYTIYLTIFYLQFSKIKINFFWLLIIFSPISFAYPLIELMVLGRKDIFIITLFLIFSIMNYKNLNSLFLYFTFFFGISTFIHEITFFYIFHYLLVIYLYKELILKEEIKKKQIIIFFIYLFLLLYLNLYLHSFVVIEDIVNSYNYENITIYSGAISHLKPSFSDVLIGTLNHIKFINILKYVGIFILSTIPFLSFIKFKNIKYFSTMNIFFLIFILSIPIYALVLDWGRVIYINYNFFIILLLLFFKLKLVDLEHLDTMIKKIDFKYKIMIFIFICLMFSPDILSKNPIEYFPLPSQFLRFAGGIFEKINELL